MKRLIDYLREKEVGENIEITEEIKVIVDDLVKKEDERVAKLQEERARRYEENKPLFDGIVNHLTTNEDAVFTATEIGKLLDVSTQKANSLLITLYNDNRVTRTKEKASAPYTYQIAK